MSPRFASLPAWLAWQEELHPDPIDLGLHRIQLVADKLFGRAAAYPYTVTVAGTNGKGTCVTTISHLLTACGKRVGSFTSPHLLRYNERIRIDGCEVSDELLCAAFEAIDSARADTSLTYFEFNALAALWIFRHEKVDIQILEVGLGGRLDAVNIIDADIAVITNIALDHTDWLGNTRDAIGTEKAGILRPGSKLVYGESDMPASIRDRITMLDCQCKQLDHQFRHAVTTRGWTWEGADDAGNRRSISSELPSLPLPSVACALQVLAWMDIWQPEIISQQLPLLSLSGRFERQYIDNKQLIFDVAHNPAGATFLANRLQATFTQRVDILFAAMADKDIGAMITALQPVINHWYLAPLDNNPRAATTKDLSVILDKHGIAATGYSCGADLQTILQAAMHVDHDTPLVIAGSFFTVAAVKAVLEHG